MDISDPEYHRALHDCIDAAVQSLGGHANLKNTLVPPDPSVQFKCGIRHYSWTPTFCNVPQDLRDHVARVIDEANAEFLLDVEYGPIR
jgi:hypothetical protein